MITTSARARASWRSSAAWSRAIRGRRLSRCQKRRPCRRRRRPEEHAPRTSADARPVASHNFEAGLQPGARPQRSRRGAHPPVRAQASRRDPRGPYARPCDVVPGRPQQAPRRSPDRAVRRQPGGCRGPLHSSRGRSRTPSGRQGSWQATWRSGGRSGRRGEAHRIVINVRASPVAAATKAPRTASRPVSHVSNCSHSARVRSRVLHDGANAVTIPKSSRRR